MLAFSTESKLEPRINKSAPLSAVVLCGGASKRMGRPKAFLPYGGKTLIEHCLSIISRVSTDIILVCNDPDEFKHLSANVVRDLVPGKGPLVGILSGLLLAENEDALVCPCDMPLIDEEIIRSLASGRDDSELILYGCDGAPEPLLGIYSKQCISVLEEMVFAGNYSMNEFMSRSVKKIKPFQAEGRQLPAHFSIDTPADYGRVLFSRYSI